MSGQQRWCSFNLGAVVNLLFSNNVLVACVTEAFLFCCYQEATEEELEKLLDRIMVLFRFIHGAYHFAKYGAVTKISSCWVYYPIYFPFDSH